MGNLHKQTVRDYFSKNWKFWEDIYKYDKNLKNLLFQISNRKNVILNFINEFAPNRNLKILDIGSGPGVLLEQLRKNGHHAVGIDISWQMIKTARETSAKFFYEKTDCVQSDIETLPFRNSLFDIITCAGVLSYLPSEQGGLAEMRRVLKPEGVILVTLPNFFRIDLIADPYNYLAKSLKIFRTKFNNKFQKFPVSPALDRKKSPKVRKYFFRDLKGMFESSGLYIKETIGLGFGPLTFWGKGVLPLNWSIGLSNYFENMSGLRILKFLNVVANHWVFYLKKSV